MEYVNYLREQQRQKEDELDRYLEATFVEETEEEFEARMKAKRRNYLEHTSMER